MENLFGSLFQSAMPLIERRALALGKRVLIMGMRVAEDVASGQNLKQAVKGRATEAGADLLDGLLKTPGRRVIKRPVRKPAVSTSKRRRMGRAPSDIFTS